MNYAKFDKGLHYYKDHLKIANGHGFCYVTEAAAKLYKAGFNLREVGEMLDYKRMTIRVLLVKMNIKRRPRGGANRLGVSKIPGVICNEKLRKWTVHLHRKNETNSYVGTSSNFVDAVKLRRDAEIKYEYNLESLAQKFLDGLKKKNRIEKIKPKRTEVINPSPYFEIKFDCQKEEFHRVKADVWGIGLKNNIKDPFSHMIIKCDLNGDIERIIIENGEKGHRFVSAILRHFGIDKKVSFNMPIELTF